MYVCVYIYVCVCVCVETYIHASMYVERSIEKWRP